MNPKAIEAAAALDAQRQSSGSMGSLHCIPVLLKDNINTADMPTSAGSAVLRNSVPRDDAPIVKALRNARALILGKAAMGAAEQLQHGQRAAGQPLLQSARPGLEAALGAAVAANFTALAVGTERPHLGAQPYFNRIVGLRPTTRLISRNGIAPRS